MLRFPASGGGVSGGAELERLFAAVAADPGLQARCGRLSQLRELVALAQEATGTAIKARQLQLWAHHEGFGALWWPWAGQSEAVRLAFFRGGPGGDEPAGI